jgi:2-oxoglutarate ferredoxin oxidoreductase subunit alpha
VAAGFAEGRHQLQTTDFRIRFAGEGGQGLLTVAEGFASANVQAGYHAQTFATFPSQITGGPTWFQVRISTEPILSRGDQLDVLVAFNESSYETHKSEVREGGVVVYDSKAFQLEDDGMSLGIPFDQLGRSTGNPRAANMVVMGTLAGLMNMPQSILEEFVTKRWGNVQRYGEKTVPQNIHGLTLGRDEAKKSGFDLGELAPPNEPDYDQIFLNGNEAICLGAAHAGLNFYAGYPISPATTILVWMENWLTAEDKVTYQVSSEIEAINAIIGGAYSGRKAMTATAGPGFSLMSEGLGFAWMAEIPIVVCDVQRGGPATGLPTKTEQSDLFAALHPAHGDVSMPVIAPGSVEECFYAAVEALNWAERYQGPVVLLSEHSLSERKENIPKPDLDAVLVEDRVVYDESIATNGYQRYEPRELSPMPLPGGPGSYIANASEHDGMGDTTHLPERHIQMTERRFGKLKLLETGTFEADNTGASIALMPWGGSKGPVREVWQRIRDAGIADNLAWYYTMYINPLPPALLEELKSKDLVIVPELNYQGQFTSVLRSHGVRAEAITQYTGLPFSIRDLMRRIEDRMAVDQKEGVSV